MPLTSASIFNGGERRPNWVCNDYEQHIAWAEYQAMMDSLALPTAPHQSAADLPQADDIKINDIGPVIRKTNDTLYLSPMRFGFPPIGRGGPVFNFRSEGRHFGDSKRCLIPASAFFEFTGTKYPKAK